MSDVRKALEAALPVLEHYQTTLLGRACSTAERSRVADALAQIDAALAAPDESPADAWRRGVEAMRAACVAACHRVSDATDSIDPMQAAVADECADGLIGVTSPPYEEPSR